MKIISEDLKHGVVELRIECEDDLWVLKNLISRNDLVVARTTRDVKVDGESKKRVPMILAVSVEEVYFQPFSGRLRIHGRVAEGPECYGLRGSYHTLSIEIGSELAIVKTNWTQEQLNRLRKASTRRIKVLLAAFDFDEVAVATILEQGVRYVAEKSLPGLKDEGPSSNEVAKEISEIILSAVERETPDVVLVASPAFLKDIVASSLKGRLRIPIVTDSVSSGGRAGIAELMKRDTFKNLLRTHNILIVEEIFEEFLSLISKEDSRAVYGLQSIRLAAEFGAVSKLLVNEDLLYGDLEDLVNGIMERVEEAGGEVRIVPEHSPTFSKVKAFGGVIAILRYSLDGVLPEHDSYSKQE